MGKEIEICGMISNKTDRNFGVGTRQLLYQLGRSFKHCSLLENGK